MESGNLSELVEKYKLHKEEHDIIFESIRNRLFNNKKTKKNPTIMFVVGQPGCGKTTYIGSINLSEYIIINSDDYRSFNKYSEEILVKYPTYYAKLTNYDAHLWGDELFSYAMQSGYSVVREKAPIDFSLLELIKTLSSENDVIVNVVVTGNLASLLATRERYEKEILKSKTAKLSDIEAHNKCYALLPEFILKCLSLGVKVNYIVAVDNHFDCIPSQEENLNLLQAIREESNEQTILNYDEKLRDIKSKMLNRNALQEQFDELRKIEDIYCQIVNGDEDKKKQK